MSETHQVFDPFDGKTVEISDRLVDRLRGRYACGPTLASGEPEFGWRQHEVAPIQKVAADRIEKLEAALTEIAKWRDDTLGARPRKGTSPENEAFDRGCRMAFYRCADRASLALKD